MSVSNENVDLDELEDLESNRSSSDDEQETRCLSVDRNEDTCPVKECTINRDRIKRTRTNAHLTIEIALSRKFTSITKLVEPGECLAKRS